MRTVRSKDGTTIAFDVLGRGVPVIAVGGAFSYRTWKGFERLAESLADRYAVVTYDHRGRGDSGETPPYVVEREIEDLHAVIEAVGEPALVWGISSTTTGTCRPSTSPSGSTSSWPPTAAERPATADSRELGTSRREMPAGARSGAPRRGLA
jgi:hypothetical protein